MTDTQSDANPASGPIRLVVSDVDGTLVTDDKVLTPASIAAAARLRAAGILLALVSSRPPKGLDEVAARLGVDTPRAGFNGGAVASPDGTLLDQLCLPEAQAREAVSFLEAQDVDVWLFADGEWLLRKPDGEYVPLERRTVRMEPRVVPDFGPYLARAGKIVGASPRFEHLAECERALQDRLGTLAHAHRSQRYYLDVTHAGADKGHAVRAIARLLRVDLAEVAAIGDQGNDLPMFPVAGHAIAMGNAPPEVQAKATWVSRSNAEDGWAWAMEQYVLPRAPAT